MFGKRIKIVPGLLFLLLMLSVCGCEEKIITVSTVSENEEEKTEYIEIKEFELKEKAQDSDRENLQYCAVMIPSGYYESEEIRGMYLHEKSPLDSSNIYYTVSEGSGEGSVSESLSEKEYKEIIETALRKSGQKGSLTIDSFEEIDMDGIPAYKIRSTYDMADNSIQQLTYLILAENTYTVTYSQSKDDELLADFEISDGMIRLVKEESVQTASAE